MERFARRAGVPRGIVSSAAHEMVERIRSEWPRINEEQLLPANFMEALERHLERIPLFSPRAVRGPHFIPTADEGAKQTEIE
jgi:hypothetical protein